MSRTSTLLIGITAILPIALVAAILVSGAGPRMLSQTSSKCTTNADCGGKLCSLGMCYACGTLYGDYGNKVPCPNGTYCDVNDGVCKTPPPQDTTNPSDSVPQCTTNDECPDEEFCRTFSSDGRRSCSFMRCEPVRYCPSPNPWDRPEDYRCAICPRGFTCSIEPASPGNLGGSSYCKLMDPSYGRSQSRAREVTAAQQSYDAAAEALDAALASATEAQDARDEAKDAYTEAKDQKADAKQVYVAARADYKAADAEEKAETLEEMNTAKTDYQESLQGVTNAKTNYAAAKTAYTTAKSAYAGAKRTVKTEASTLKAAKKAYEDATR